MYKFLQILVLLELSSYSETGPNEGFQLVSRTKKIKNKKKITNKPISPFTSRPNSPFRVRRKPEKRIEMTSKEFPPLTKPSERLSINNQTPTPILMPKPKAKKARLLVFDTNMWMTSDGQEVILDVMVNDHNFKIFVPWIVSHELDKKKATSDLARTGLSYRESFVQAYADRIINQTAIERSETKEANVWITKNDDEIIACCLKLKQIGFDVALSTKDKNLKVDASANGITTYPPCTVSEKRKIRQCLEKRAKLDQLNNEICKEKWMIESLNFSVAFHTATQEQREKAWSLFP